MATMHSRRRISGSRATRFVGALLVAMASAVVPIGHLPSASAASPCVWSGNLFDGAIDSHESAWQGAKAQIGEFAQGNPAICNTNRSTSSALCKSTDPSPCSSSSSWAMVSSTNCGKLGFFQAGYVRDNWASPSSFTTYYFSEQATCSSLLPVQYFAAGNPNVYECYLVNHSATDRIWTAGIFTTGMCPASGNGSGTQLWATQIHDVNLWIHTG